MLERPEPDIIIVRNDLDRYSLRPALGIPPDPAVVLIYNLSPRVVLISKFDLIRQDPSLNDYNVSWLEMNLQAQVENANVSAGEVTKHCDDSVWHLGIM